MHYRDITNSGPHPPLRNNVKTRKPTLYSGVFFLVGASFFARKLLSWATPVKKLKKLFDLANYDVKTLQQSVHLLQLTEDFLVVRPISARAPTFFRWGSESCSSPDGGKPYDRVWTRKGASFILI